MSDDSLKLEIEKFWLSAKQKGLPLIEKDSLDQDYTYSTIIFQDSSKNKEIRFKVFGIYEDNSMGDMKLRRLRNSDLYYRSYKIPKDFCFSYQFTITDTLTGKSNKTIDRYNTDRIPKRDRYWI